MCRGLAVGLCRDRFFCEGISSHSQTIPRHLKDKTLKLEIIIDSSQERGYSVELDEQYFYNGKIDGKVLELLGRNGEGYLTATGKISRKTQKKINDWVIENEPQILRWLLKCQTYQRGGNIEQSHAQADAYIEQNKAHAGAYIHQQYAKARREVNQNYAEAGTYIDQSNAKARGSINQHRAEAGGCIIQSHAKAGTEIYIAFSKSGLRDGMHEEENAYIEKLSNINGELTLAQIARLAMSASQEEIERVMKNE